VSVTASNTYSVELKGVDGTNPLGFLCALGTLVVLRQAGESAACLRWKRARTWTPVLDGLTTVDGRALYERLAVALRGKSVSDDAGKQRDTAQKEFEQAKTAVKKEKERIKKEQIKEKSARDEAIRERVRPLETAADEKRRKWLEALKAAVPRPELALGARIDCKAGEFREHAIGFADASDPDSREALGYLAAFGSDGCVEDGDASLRERSIVPTPFCFIRGSGNQNFLDTVRKLLGKVSIDRLAHTLCEPWTFQDEGLSMRWDPSEDKRYALTDVRPSDEGARTVWMANLLAYRALALFPCAPTRRGLETTAWAQVKNENEFTRKLGEEHTRRRDAWAQVEKENENVFIFTWPLWEFAAAPDTVRTMLQLRELQEKSLDNVALVGRGIAAVFRARRIRFPPRGPSYKLNFSPARQLL
jgi:hypothetical protein